MIGGMSCAYATPTAPQASSAAIAPKATSLLQPNIAPSRSPAGRTRRHNEPAPIFVPRSAAGDSGNTGTRQRRLLPARQRRFVEIVDQLVEEAVPVDLRLQMHEHRAQPDRGSIHKDKGARRRDPAQAPDVLMHAVDEAGALRLAAPFLDRPGAVVESEGGDLRPVDDSVSRKVLL